MPKRLTLILLVCVYSLHLTAQSTDSNIHDDSTDAMVVYYQSLRQESPLYNGKEYIEYAYTLQEGHPFFQSPDWMIGTIHFEGMTFREVPMIYDIVKDQVIIQDFQRVFKINLPADKIQQFTVAGHTFIRLIRGENDRIKTGFYDQLYHGKISLYVRREKKITETYGLQIVKGVSGKNIYYIKKNGNYYDIRNKGELIDLLKDHKKEVQQYLKKTGTNFRDDPETVMASAVEYYDKITN